MRNQWLLSYGWSYRLGQPITLSRDKQRPREVTTLPFHSFEAALHYPSCGSWWEIYTPDGQVAMSSHSGFNEEAVPSPSLCARQILFPEENPLEEVRDRVSYDDGETWESILLGEKEEVRKPILPPLPKPESVEILTISPASSPEPGRIILTHATGSMTVKVAALELKKSRTGYSLRVLGTRSGTYTQDVGEGAAILLQSLGVPIAGEKEKLPKGFVKAWKPALFKIHQKKRQLLEVRGFTRGLLGIDKREVEISRVWYDCNGEERAYTYTEVRWYLTHIPTGRLIASWKHRNSAEEFADYLRERMPELADTGVEEVTPEIGKRVKQILDEYSA